MNCEARLMETYKYIVKFIEVFKKIFRMGVIVIISFKKIIKIKQ